MTTSPHAAVHDAPEWVNARGGVRLYIHRWSIAQPKATVLIVHGLGEHGGRYAHVAQWFNARGYSVFAYDQRGHGKSEGARGSLLKRDDPFEDLADVLWEVNPEGEPLILLGHSAGGAFAARFALDHPNEVGALVISSPAFAADLTAWQRFLLTVGGMLAPTLAQPNGLNPTYISHERRVVEAYTQDPLVHDRVTARLAKAILEAGDAAVATAPAWRVPTLLLYAGDDHFVAPRGSDAFAAAAPRDLVTAVRFDALYHEILNEGALAEPVYARLEQWLSARETA